MIADTEPRPPLHCWAAKASGEVMFVVMLGWNLAKRVTRQEWSRCAGGGGLGSEQELSPHILLPLTHGVRDNVKVHWSGKSPTDMHRHRSLPQDAGSCPGASNAGISPSPQPYPKPPAMPEATICKGDASSWERFHFQKLKQIHTGIFLTFPNPQLKSTLRGPGTMLPFKCRKPLGWWKGWGWEWGS